MADLRFKIQQLDAGAAHWLGWAKKEVRRLAELMPAFTRTWVHGDVTVRAQYHEGSGTARLWLTAATAATVVRNCLATPDAPVVIGGRGVYNLTQAEDAEGKVTLSGGVFDSEELYVYPVTWAGGRCSAALSAQERLADYWQTTDLGLQAGLVVRSLRPSDLSSFVVSGENDMTVSARVQNHGGVPYVVVVQSWLEPTSVYNYYSHHYSNGTQSASYSRDTRVYGVQVLDFKSVRAALPVVEEVEMEEEAAYVTWSFLGDTLRLKMSIVEATDSVRRLKTVNGETAVSERLDMYFTSTGFTVRGSFSGDEKWEYVYDADSWLSTAMFNVYYTGAGGRSIMGSGVHGSMLVLAGAEVYGVVVNQPSTDSAEDITLREESSNNGTPDESGNYSVDERLDTSSRSTISTMTRSMHTDAFGLFSFTSGTSVISATYASHTWGTRSNGHARYIDETVDSYHYKRHTQSKATYYLQQLPPEQEGGAVGWQLSTIQVTLEAGPRAGSYSKTHTYGTAFYDWASWTFEGPGYALYNFNETRNIMHAPETGAGETSRYSNGYVYYPSLTTYPISTTAYTSQTGYTLYYSYTASANFLQPYVYTNGAWTQHVSPPPSGMKGGATIPELGLYIGSTYIYSATEGFIFGALTGSDKALQETAAASGTFSAAYSSLSEFDFYDERSNTTTTGAATFAGGGGGSHTDNAVTASFGDYKPLTTGIDLAATHVLTAARFTAVWVWNAAGGTTEGNLLVVVLLIDPFAQLLARMRTVTTKAALLAIESDLIAARNALRQDYYAATEELQTVYAEAGYDAEAVTEEHDALQALCKSWYLDDDGALGIDTAKRTNDMQSRRCSSLLWSNKELAITPKLLDWCTASHVAMVHPASGVKSSPRRSETP